MDIPVKAAFSSQIITSNTYPSTKNIAGRQEIATGSLGEQVSITPVLRGGIENIRTLGTLVLGGETQLKEWEAKGLVVTDETLRRAYDVLNESFKEHLENSRNQATSFNRHQIIAASQEVPEWFLLEYKNELASIAQKDIRESFASGALYYLSETAQKRSDSSVYSQIETLGKPNDLSGLFSNRYR